MELTRKRIALFQSSPNMYNMYYKTYNVLNLCVSFFIGIALVTTGPGETRQWHSINESSIHFENTTGFEETKTVSFTEMFLEQLFGRKINLKKLLSEYSAVCLLQQSCGVDYDGLLLIEDLYYLKAFSGCEVCTCGPHCVRDGNCCPGSHYGYLKHECVNTTLYPHDNVSTSYMVDKCPIRYTSNNTVIDLCKNQLRPCSGVESNFTFKNMFCAQCNYEHDCVPWTLDVDCKVPYKSEGMFQSISEIKSVIDEYGCVIQYRFHRWSTGGTCRDIDNLRQVRIDKCNVTGLWQMYDADLEWACENFNTPYKMFKNVFCYICNPSQAYSQTVRQIDKCSIFENGSNSPSALIKEACKVFPAIERLWPFKNRYCYACSDGQSLLINSKTDLFSLLDISENNDQMTLQTELKFSLVFDTPKELERFVQDNLKEAFRYIYTKPHKKLSKSFYTTSSIENMINTYIGVCGAQNVCSDKVIDEQSDYTYGNPVCGECACNTTCAENENCCPDIIVSKQPYSCIESKSILSLGKLADSNSEWHSVPILEKKSYKIVDACLEGDHPLANSCSSYDTNVDLLSNIPVSTAANVMYRNIYCYYCNNNKSDVSLNIQAMCDTYIEHELFTEVAELIRAVKVYCNRISFVPLNSKQCKTYDPVTASYVGGIEHNRMEMHPSTFDFETVESRRVRAGHEKDPAKIVYFSCNQTGYLEERNILMTEVCETEAVDLLSLPEYNVGNTVYKNFACFLCNPDFMSSDINPNNVIPNCLADNSTVWFEQDDNLDNLCRRTEANLRWFPYKNMYCAECNLPPWQRVHVRVAPMDMMSPFDYSYLFSLSPEDFGRIETARDDSVIPQCPDGTYDFSLNRCRLLYCNEGFELFNTTCRPVPQMVPNKPMNSIYSISLELINTEKRDLRRYESSLTLNTSKINLVELCEKIIEMMTTSLDHTTVFTVLGSHCRVQTSCETTENLSFTESVNFTVSDSSAAEPLRLFFDISNNKVIRLAAVIRISYSNLIAKDVSALVNSMNKIYHLQDITDIEGSLQSVILRSGQTDDWKWQAYDNTCSVIKGEQLFYYTFTQIDKFLVCPYVKLNLSEAHLQKNYQLIVLNKANATFNKNEYKFIGSHFIICIDDYDRERAHTTLGDEPTVSSHGTENILNIVNEACTIISLVCLFLTFTVYCIFSSLRTIPGKNLMLLCLSLFCAQGLLLFGSRATNNSAVCICIGIGIHYFWIAAFCAIHVCSFHMFKVFYFDDLSNESLRHKRSLFLKYLLYVTFFPLVCVLVTVFSNSMNTHSVSAGYGGNICFISNFYIFIGTFLIPATLIFLNNIVFFILAFHSIRRSPNVPSNREKKKFCIFLRLCTIVGITWPLLILGNVVNIMWFSFVVASINALQGVYIFISFILNRRVLSMCAAPLRAQTGSSALRNAQST